MELCVYRVALLTSAGFNLIELDGFAGLVWTEKLCLVRSYSRG